MKENHFLQLSAFVFVFCIITPEISRYSWAALEHQPFPKISLGVSISYFILVQKLLLPSQSTLHLTARFKPTALHTRCFLCFSSHNSRPPVHPTQPRATMEFWPYCMQCLPFKFPANSVLVSPAAKLHPKCSRQHSSSYARNDVAPETRKKTTPALQFHR